MRVYERLILPPVARMEPERAHGLTLAALAGAQRIGPLLWLASRTLPFRDQRLEITWRGMTFPNPVGVAAGFDKDARVAPFLEAAGFGFVEVGTLTPRPQPGNPRPRLHRVPRRKALVNSLGFPGGGAAQAARRLSRRRRPRVPMGINIGKNAATSLDDAWRDYVRCLEVLYPYGDYFTVNVSSPNTPGLTSLQARPALASILRPLNDARKALGQRGGKPPAPLLLKISPDLSREEIDGVLETAVEHGVEGLIATNTSADPELKGDQRALRGGISGAPLHSRAVEVLAHARQCAPRDFLMVGAGGVFSAQEAWNFFQVGADLVQLYTGMVYRGPGIAASINRGLLRLLSEHRLPSIEALRASRGS